MSRADRLSWTIARHVRDFPAGTAFTASSSATLGVRLAQELLGCRLFVRNKAGAALTAAGRQFQKHASTLVRTVAQARQDVHAAAPDREPPVVAGGAFRKR